MENVLENVTVTELKPKNQFRRDFSLLPQITNQTEDIDGHRIDIIKVESEDFNTKEEPVEAEYITVKSEIDESSPINEFACDDKLNNMSTNASFGIQRPFQCNICNFRFTYKGSLKTHLRVHTGEKPFQCKVCNCKYSQKGDLRRHMQGHAGNRPFECEICKQKFLRKSYLERHQHIHTGEKPFKCDYCEYKCARKHYLQSHMIIHTAKERQFECKICKFKFIRKCNLNDHMRVHTGERPYQCELCDYKCTQKITLRSHLKKIHNLERLEF